MPSIVNTYGCKKKKRRGLPKLIRQSHQLDSSPKDVFEALFIDNIKHIKTQQDTSRNTKAKKKRPAAKPINLPCETYWDNTFDRLLEEGPVQRPIDNVGSSNSMHDSSETRKLIRKSRTGTKLSSKITKKRLKCKNLKNNDSSSFFSELSHVDDHLESCSNSKSILNHVQEENREKGVTLRNPPRHLAASNRGTKLNIQAISPILPLSHRISTSTPLRKSNSNSLTKSALLLPGVEDSDLLSQKNEGNCSVLCGIYDTEQCNDLFNNDALSCDLLSSLEQHQNSLNVQHCMHSNGSVDLFTSSDFKEVHQCMNSISTPKPSFANNDFCHSASASSCTRGNESEFLRKRGSTSGCSVVLSKCNSGVVTNELLRSGSEKLSLCDSVHPVELDLLKDCKVLLPRVNNIAVPSITVETLEADCCDLMDCGVILSHLEVDHLSKPYDCSSHQSEGEKLLSGITDPADKERDLEDNCFGIKDCRVMLSRLEVNSVNNLADSFLNESKKVQNLPDITYSSSREKELTQDSSGMMECRVVLTPLRVNTSCKSSDSCLYENESAKRVSISPLFTDEEQGLVNNFGACRASTDSPSYRRFKNTYEQEREEGRCLSSVDNNLPMATRDCRVNIAGNNENILFRSSLKRIDEGGEQESVSSPQVPFDLPSALQFEQSTLHDSAIVNRPSLNICRISLPENIILRPGKKWRRSLSILTKVRTSGGHSLPSNGSFRKSIYSKSSKFKGKQWQSTVDAVIGMQPSDSSLEGIESSFNSINFEDSVSEGRRQNISEESVILCDMPSQVTPLSSSAEIFARCNQDGPVPFLHQYPSSMKKNCKKIGEGVYGEVFFYTDPSEKRSSVIKIIPIEGDIEVNGEPQKMFGEILSEVQIAQELSNLRRGIKNNTSNFNEVHAIRCVQGKYPDWLQELWCDFNDSKGSENDSPVMFGSDQLYVVLELGNGGKDLESFVFSSALQGLAVFKQIALALAVGETALNFEHRDLHWGNVLIAQTKKKDITYIISGETYSTPSKGVEVSIIDFTLSRISDPSTGKPVFYDLAKDETLFNAQGDYQFEIYRLMKQYCGNNWSLFAPKTNIAWLHYLLDKLCSMARYRNRSSKGHCSAMEVLYQMKDCILNYPSPHNFVKFSLFGD